MKKKIGVVCLAVLLLMGNARAGIAQQPAPVAGGRSAASDKIKRQVEKVGLNGRVTVELASGAKVFGAIKNIEDSSFYVSEADHINLAVINYGDVTKVRKGYCEDRLFGKARSCPSAKRSLITGAALLGGIILAVALSLPKT